MKFKINQLILNILIMCVVFCALLMNDSFETNVLVSWIILLLNVYLMFKTWKNWYAFLISMFIFLFNYSICIANYISPVSSWFTRWNKEVDFMVPIMNILLFFMSVLAIFTPKLKKSDNNNFKDSNPENNFISLGISFVLMVIFFFGYSRTSLGTRGGSTSVYEYAIILFILAYYYSGNKLMDIYISFILFMFIGQDILFGNRATALQLLICWFLIFISYRVSIRKMIPLMLLAMVAFSGIGLLRDNIINEIAINQIINDLLEKKLTIDTAYAAFFTSCTFYRTELLIADSERIGMFIKFIISQFLGGNIVNGSDLSVFSHDYYAHWYGGVLPYYWHFYLGYCGVGLIALYISTLIKKFWGKVSNLKKNNSGLAKCLGLFFVCTTPRWYLYSPFPVFRGFLLLIIFFEICNLFHRKIGLYKSNIC